MNDEIGRNREIATMHNVLRVEMPRRLRFIPDGHMVEITLRTIQGRFLLRPTRETNLTVTGAIGRAQRQTEMMIHAVVAMGNHMHLLITPRDAEQMASFMNQVASSIARKVGKQVGWREKFWGRRYHAIVVSNEERAQVGRLEYLLSHGCKEGLVLRPEDWPGIHPARPLGNGTMFMRGLWHDATAAYRDRCAGKMRPRRVYETPERIFLSPLPCWSNLPGAEHQRRILGMIDSIEKETRERHRRSGTAPSGTRAVLAHEPHEKPDGFERSPPPAFHAASTNARLWLREAYASFVIAYREGTDALRRSKKNLSAAFPKGCFPPALPFVPG